MILLLTQTASLSIDQDFPRQRKFLSSSPEEPTLGTEAPHNLYTCRKQRSQQIKMSPLTENRASHPWSIWRHQECQAHCTPKVTDLQAKTGHGLVDIQELNEIMLLQVVCQKSKKILGNIQIQVQGNMSKRLNSIWKILFAHTHLYTPDLGCIQIHSPAVCRRHALQ